MNAQLVKTEPQLSQVPTWTEADVTAVKDLIAKDATPEEMKLFLYTATQRGLNPLLKQIYCIHRNGKMSIQTGIDGLRLIAHRTNKLAGIKRGIRKEDGEIYAWAEVQRKDSSTSFLEEVAMSEFRQTTPVWQKMPQQMLKKCAEAAALRMAFPEDLSGLYTDDEMPTTKPIDGIQAPPEEQAAYANEKDLIRKAIANLMKEFPLILDNAKAEELTKLEFTKKGSVARESIDTLKEAYFTLQAFVEDMRDIPLMGETQ